MKLQVCKKDEVKCVDCGFCCEVLACANRADCVGCMACFYGCPYEARRIVEDRESRKSISVELDGEVFEVSERITVRKALESAGVSFGIGSEDGDIQAPCSTGGCYSCLVQVDGELVRSCVTEAKDGMKISTSLPEDYVPRRIISGPQPHSVGGKGTPWALKKKFGYIEVAIWAAGCNLRCSQCQNFNTTYDGTTEPVTPQQAAVLVTSARKKYGVNRMAISGGEPTLNRKWLVQYFQELKRMNPDKEARLHLDSNGTLLTEDYIDELVEEGGMTDIGVEPKGVYRETFMRITGIKDEGVAERYLRTAWNAIEYVAKNYSDRVFLGVGLPYNEELIELKEVKEFGKRVASINPAIQVSVLDYFPAFRRRDLKRPAPEEMIIVKKILERAGLEVVVVQTQVGHFGPK